MSKASADVLRDAWGLTHGSRLRAVICSHGTHSHCNSPELGAPAAPGHPRPWSGEWKEVPVLLRLEGGSRGILGLWCRSSPGHCLSPLRSPGMLLGTGSSERAQPQPRLLGKSRKKITGLRCPQDPPPGMEPLSPQALLQCQDKAGAAPFSLGTTHRARDGQSCAGTGIPGLCRGDPCPGKGSISRGTIPTHPQPVPPQGGMWEPRLGKVKMFPKLGTG